MQVESSSLIFRNVTVRRSTLLVNSSRILVNVFLKELRSSTLLLSYVASVIMLQDCTYVLFLQRYMHSFSCFSSFSLCAFLFPSVSLPLLCADFVSLFALQQLSDSVLVGPLWGSLVVNNSYMIVKNTHIYNASTGNSTIAVASIEYSTVVLWNCVFSIDDAAASSYTVLFRFLRSFVIIRKSTFHVGAASAILTYETTVLVSDVAFEGKDGGKNS